MFRNISLSLLSLIASAFSLQAQSSELGKQVYMAVCVACHQPTGAGLPPVFPPIIKTEYIEGSAERLTAMVLKGVMGPISVNGVVFNNVMPPQEAMLTDEKIAAVLTFVRSNFGNSASPVSVALVQGVRKKLLDRKVSWNEAELKAWPKE